MNAVEAAEQLIALGQRVQAAERRWQRPVAALQLGGLGEQAPVDPLAALETLLDVAVGQPSTSAPRPAPRRHERDGQIHPPLPTSPPPLPPAFAGALEPAENRQTREQNAPAEPSPLHSLTHSPAQATRLVRRQSSLLGILSANVAEREPDNMTGNAAAPAHGAAHADPGAPAAAASDWRPKEQTLVGAPPAAEGSFGRGAAPSPAASGAPRAGEAGRDAPANPPGAGAQAAAPGEFAPRQAAAAAAATASGPGARSGGADFTAADAAQPLDYLFLPPVVGEVQTTAPGLALPNGTAANLPGLPASAQDMAGPGEAVWPLAPDSAAERPLTSRQIDQVLDALDARLELLLLRTYGTSADG